MIKVIHEESRQNYGSPRVFKELQARGEPCNVKTVAKIMRENDIVAKRRRPRDRVERDPPKADFGILLAVLSRLPSTSIAGPQFADAA